MVDWFDTSHVVFGSSFFEERFRENLLSNSFRDWVIYSYPIFKATVGALPSLANLRAI